MDQLPIVCFDKESTYPAELSKIIEESQYFQSLSSVYYNIRDEIVSPDNPQNPLLYELNKKINDILSLYSFEGFHNTRVLDESEVTNNGLYVLEKTQYFNNVQRCLTIVGVSPNKQTAVIDTLDEYFTGKRGERTGKLSLFAPKCYGVEFSKFIKNVGGEICEFGLKDSFPDIYKKLTQIGIPLTVKFRFRIEDVVDINKNWISREFLKYYWDKRFRQHNNVIKITCELGNPIPPGNIIDIVPLLNKKSRRNQN